MLRNFTIFKHVSIVGFDIKEAVLNQRREKINRADFVWPEFFNSYWLSADYMCNLLGIILF